MRRISELERRSLLVARQLIGVEGRHDRALNDVTATLALLHSTDPSTPYLSIHARSDATIAEVDAAFFDDRTLVRHTTIRRTVFAMPLDVAALAHGAFNAQLVAKLRSNLLGWIAASPDTDDDPATFLGDVEDAVVEHLRAGRPATGNALADAVPGLRVRFDPVAGASYSRPMRITSKVLELLAAEGRTCRGRPTGGSFTSGSWTWEPAERWFGPEGIERIEPSPALAGLVTRHLAAFGPATVTDIAWWSGLPKTKVRAALVAIDAVEVSLDGTGEPGWIRPDDDVIDTTRLASGADDRAVALLPGLDSTTMGWKQRSWYVDDRPSTGLFDRNGNAGPTIWFGGRVVGTWTQRANGEVATLVTADLSAGDRTDLDRRLADEIDRLRVWLGDVRVKWRYPTPLTKQLFE